VLQVWAPPIVYKNKLFTKKSTVYKKIVMSPNCLQKKVTKALSVNKHRVVLDMAFGSDEDEGRLRS